MAIFVPNRDEVMAEDDCVEHGITRVSIHTKQER
jgi:hypothetical protein